MKKSPAVRFRALYLSVFLFIPGPFAFGQGTLTPPGAPAPTMKTLQQIEPRIDLQNAPASAVTTTNAAYHYIISQPGSYYLSANLGVTKTNGIQINAEGVTLDLNGFEISRASGSGGNGIEIPATSHHASISHGSLKGFSSGIASLTVAAAQARACSFRELIVSGCTNFGIHAGEQAVLEFCRVHGNSGAAGIETGTGATLTHCIAVKNTAGNAIYAGDGSSLFACTAAENGSRGITTGSGCTITACAARANGGNGIFAGSGSVITGCAARNNGSNGILSNGGGTISGCVAQSNATGIYSIGGGTIVDCSVSSNTGDGILVISRTLVRGNDCLGNGSGATVGAGIHVTGSDNRIESNNSVGADRGIYVTDVGNTLIKNTVSGNTTANWDVIAGNILLVITAAPAAAVMGDSGGTSPGSTNPNANYTY